MNNTPKYKAGSTFNKPKDIQDAAIQKYLEDMALKLNNEFRRLERTSAGSQNVTSSQASQAEETATSTGASIEYRSEEVALVAGVNTVTFNSPLTTTRVMLEKVTNASGYKILDYTISNEIAAGFDINVPEVCTIFYIAMGKK